MAGIFDDSPLLVVGAIVRVNLDVGPIGIGGLCHIQHLALIGRIAVYNLVEAVSQISNLPLLVVIAIIRLKLGAVKLYHRRRRGAAGAAGKIENGPRLQALGPSSLFKTYAYDGSAPIWISRSLNSSVSFA